MRRRSNLLDTRTNLSGVFSMPFSDEAPAASGRAESSSPEPLPQAADRPSRRVSAVAARIRCMTVLVWWLVVMRPLQPLGRSENIG